MNEALVNNTPPQPPVLTGADWKVAAVDPRVLDPARAA
jgi:hypothetical protein